MPSPNRAILAQFWHPVAYAEALTTIPLSVMLIGERIVLWRDAAGTARAMRDRCVHRGTALSIGRIQGNEIVCPYHGWRYGVDGRCVHIPQLQDPARVPERARIAAFQCEERYGLIWVALADPIAPIPDVPELDDLRWHTVRTGPFAWHANASRQLENFTDFGHFAFVHEGLLGDARKATVAPYDVEIDGRVVRYTYHRPDEPNTEGLAVFAADDKKKPIRATRYAIHLPYTIVEHIGWGGDEGMVYFFVSQPVDAEHCIGYCLVARNYHFDQSDEVMKAFERTIFAQDERIIESQEPCEIPFTSDHELHLAFDKVAIAYREAMRNLGIR